jgi:hypothetical protein
MGLRCQTMADRSESTSLFLSIPQAARELGIGIERLKKAVALHQVRSITLGSRVLIPRAAILKLAGGDEPKDAA